VDRDADSCPSLVTEVGQTADAEGFSGVVMEPPVIRDVSVVNIDFKKSPGPRRRVQRFVLSRLSIELFSVRIQVRQSVQ